MVEKKNADYSASAVNLVNPVEVSSLLHCLRAARGSLQEVAQRIEDSIPAELKAEREKLVQESTAMELKLRENIETFGSYQDVAAGEYALKQMRKTVAYEPSLVRDNLEPKLAQMVIIESVDKTKLSGLVKGGFISQEQSDRCGIAKIDYAIIIK